MELFFTLLGKTLPLYFNIILGYLGSKILNISRDTIAKTLIYIFGPILVFNATLNVELEYSTIFLPVSVYLFGSFIAFATLKIFNNYWNDSTVNILAFSNGTGNTGYFGIPLALLLLDEHLANIYIFTVLASFLYENSTGFYVTAKGNYTGKEAIKKIIKLPLIYGFFLGLLLNILQIKLPEIITNYTSGFNIVYGILGMMMIGIGLNSIKENGAIDKRFLIISLGVKFILWPMVTFIFIYLDKNFLMLLNNELYKVMILFSITPLAGNAVTLAVILKSKPEKISLAVLISTAIAIFYIPLIISIYNIN